MSVEFINGKSAQRPKAIEGPTPGQVAERAYDLATERAVAAVDSQPIDIPGVNLGEFVREFMRERRANTLAALRESVINPPVVPWWKK